MTNPRKFKANPNKLLPNPIFGGIIPKNHRLTEQKTQGIISTQSQKTIAEPRNSFYLLQGEQHAILNRAFFVRSFFTPKTRLETLSGSERQSMVVRNGKGSPFAVYLVGRFSSPLRTTAQSLETLAVVPEILIQGLSTMLYLFKAVSRLDLRNTKKPFSSFPCYTLRIYADSLEQAKAKVCPLYAVLAINGGQA